MLMNQEFLKNLLLLVISICKSQFWAGCSSVNHFRMTGHRIHEMMHGPDPLKDIRKLPPLLLFSGMTMRYQALLVSISLLSLGTMLESMSVEDYMLYI